MLRYSARLFMIEQLSLSIFLMCVFFGRQVKAEVNLSSDNLCGPNSLFIAAVLLDVKTNRDELARCAGITDSGTTLYGLKKAAIEKGLYAIGIQTTLEALRQYDAPIIAHVGNDDHFLVIAGFEGARVKIINPPQEPFTLSSEDFERIWTGKALIVSTKKEDLDKDTSQSLHLLYSLTLLVVLSICIIGLWGIFIYRHGRQSG